MSNKDKKLVVILMDITCGCSTEVHNILREVSKTSKITHQENMGEGISNLKIRDIDLKDWDRWKEDESFFGEAWEEIEEEEKEKIILKMGKQGIDKDGDLIIHESPG
ncbi:hypothetical protein LCGC14_0245880 [marine sediment metagenome]|uniref:Uncharacterized protein n=1 Tax=marine sediment metagenome TaxID=412755 RepID=A0A0F9UMF4_9ZZZZ